MKLLDSFAFYFLFCPTVLIYGVGTLQAAETSLARKKIALTAAKSLFCVLASVSISYSFMQLLLIPLSLQELYPLAALLIFAAVSVFTEILFQLTAKKGASEFSVSFLTVVLALNEGSRLLDAILISVCCLAGYYLLVPLLQAFTAKMAATRPMDALKQRVSVFLCMMILMLALFALNISWINAGV